jgi:hypothetical protein
MGKRGGGRVRGALPMLDSAHYLISPSSSIFVARLPHKAMVRQDDRPGKADRGGEGWLETTQKTRVDF